MDSKEMEVNREVENLNFETGWIKINSNFINSQLVNYDKRILDGLTKIRVPVR